MNPDFETRNLAPDEPSGGPPASTRRASVQLSRGTAQVQTTEDLMATANKSLSDALAVTLRIVQFSMVVLFLLFLVSGVQSVREGQRAIRLVFGRIQAANLPPGFQLSWPFPIGELVKIDTGVVTIALDSQFWPRINDQAKGNSIDALSKDPKLKPENDGSLITADANLAHAQWRVQYQREDTEKFAENMLLPYKQGDTTVDMSRDIVTAACARGIVRAVAQTKVEDLLRQAAGETGHVAEMAKSIAQKQLDQLQSGIQITRFELTSVTPPMYVREAFNSVQAATSKAQAAIEKAETEAKQLFNNNSGEIEPYLIREIDMYELAVNNKDEKARAEYLDRINRMLEGKPVTVDGRVIENKASGEVAQMISQAFQYKGEVVNLRRAELANFRAKLSQYKSNPSVMLHREWSEAITAFLDRDSVQLMLVPLATRTLELQLSEDPVLAKRRETALRQQQNQEAKQRREEEQRKSEFNTQVKTPMSS
ncbi:MAG: SPFH domain-containing protein [Phycisphaerales bacterium]